MLKSHASVALIKGDGIGIDVSEAAIEIAHQATKRIGGCNFTVEETLAGAGYFQDTGHDVEPGGEVKVGRADAIFLGAIGLPSIRYTDGTEVSPHLRLRDQYGLYAGVRPVKAYANSPQRLADPRAANIDMVILRESTEGLFYSAAVHRRSQIIADLEVCETLKITRKTTEKLHQFGFKLAKNARIEANKALSPALIKLMYLFRLPFLGKFLTKLRSGILILKHHIIMSMHRLL